eukprot:GSMAST32.ASY1.ANO1.1803.1 assembled CDS
MAPITMKKHDSRFSAPTEEESRHLRSLSSREGNLNSVLKSNLWQLEIKELLSEFSVNYEKLSGIQEVMFALKSAIDTIPDQTVTESTLSLSGICCQNRHTKPVELSFKSPARVDVVGSFLIRSLAKPSLNIDVAIEIPDACITPKDYLNHRYTDKRALYLGVVAQELKKTKLFKKVWLEGFRGDLSKIVLCLQPTETSATSSKSTNSSLSKCVLRILPCVSADAFSHGKLALRRNNVRRRCFLDEPQPATPLYNNSILEDMCFRDHLQQLHALALESPSFAQACILLKIWSRRRQLHEASDSVNGFQLCILLLHLFRTGVVTPQMDPYHIFRLTIEFIANTDVAESGILIPAPNDAEDSEENSDENDDEIISERIPAVNIFSRVSTDAYIELRHLAKQSAIAFLGDPVDAFHSIFMISSGFDVNFDEFFTEPQNIDSDSQDTKKQLIQAKRDLPIFNSLCDQSWPIAFRNSLARTMAYALGDRVQMIRVRDSVGCKAQWGVFESPPTYNSNKDNAPVMSLALRLNEPDAWRLVEKGPAADSGAPALACMFYFFFQFRIYFSYEILYLTNFFLKYFSKIHI